MKFFKKKNILILIKKKPYYIPLIFLNIIKGLLLRKSKIYKILKKDKRINRKIQKLDLSKLSITYDNSNFWKNEFYNNKFISNWNLKRNFKLRNFFFDLMNYDSVPDNPSDKEEFWSTLQLNWLFYEVRSNQLKCEDAKSIINKACSFMEKNKNSWLYRQFTISEMITNIIKIKLYFGNSFELQNDTTTFLKKGIFFVLNNLEIFLISNKNSFNHTNNHLLANVRALFWGTKIFHNNELYKIAKEIYKNYCLELFDDGVLNEGSVIYHFISAQYIYDISFFIDIKDIPRVDKLINSMKKNNFLEPSTFPVVGDVSPDPCLGAVINDALKISKILSRLDDKSEIIKNKISDYEIIKHGKWSIFFHTRKKNKHIQHSHDDYGSPIINYGNRNVIIDLGRPVYSKNIESEDYTSSKLHSVPQIDGLEQNPRSIRDIYPYYFLNPLEILNLQDYENLKFDKSNNLKIFEKTFKLFPNLLHGGFWNRSLNVSNQNRNKNKIIIEDLVYLDSPKKVKFKFFVPQKSFVSENVSYKFYNDCGILDYDIKQVSCNDSYGEAENAYSYEIDYKPASIHKLKTEIKITNE